MPPGGRRPGLLLVLLAAASGSAACPGLGGDVRGDGLDVTWESDVRALVRERCFPCHMDPPSHGAPVALASYEAAYDRRFVMGRRAVWFGTMPPGRPLGDRDRAVLAAWIDGGAPRGEPLDDGPGELTWDGELGPLLAERCVFDGCHGSTATQRGLFLGTYEGFLAGGQGGDLRGGGDPGQSLLIKRLRGLDGLLRMPDGGPYLDEPTMERIEAWIRAGAPESAR